MATSKKKLRPMAAPKHPMQPLTAGPYGTVRFKQNAIVCYLIDEGRKHRCGLNELAAMPFSQEDWIQFYQLIGYSLSGFHELSKVPDSVARRASAAARKAGFGKKAIGCRDEGCRIHCGVEEENTERRVNFWSKNHCDNN